MRQTILPGLSYADHSGQEYALSLLDRMHVSAGRNAFILKCEREQGIDHLFLAVKMQNHPAKQWQKGGLPSGDTNSHFLAFFGCHVFWAKSVGLVSHYQTGTNSECQIHQSDSESILRTLQLLKVLSPRRSTKTPKTDHEQPDNDE